MGIKELIERNRSYRRYDQNVTVEREVLEELVELARKSASARNLQPLKYALVHDRERNAIVFDHVGWAGYLTTWSGPAEGERPSAYIVVLGDTTIATDFGCDHGIAAQSILLGAVERGLGGCMIASVRRAELAAALDIPRHLRVLLVIALGQPAERVVLEDVGPSGSIEYYRDRSDVHHVPKRPVSEIVVG